MGIREKAVEDTVPYCQRMLKEDFWLGWNNDDYSAQGWTNGPNARHVAMLTLEISLQSGESIFMDKKQLRVRRSSSRIRAARESALDLL